MSPGMQAALVAASEAGRLVYVRGGWWCRPEHAEAVLRRGSAGDLPTWPTQVVQALARRGRVRLCGRPYPVEAVPVSGEGVAS